MQFDPDNAIIQLCAQGMDMEVVGKADEARRLFLEAWNTAGNEWEKCIAAHYLARSHKNAADKLEWDKTAIKYAKKIKETGIRKSFPSLYLNVAKGYEDLGHIHEAELNYKHAVLFSRYLEDDGYGNMIRGGIADGLKRISKSQ